MSYKSVFVILCLKHMSIEERQEAIDALHGALDRMSSMCHNRAVHSGNLSSYIGNTHLLRPSEADNLAFALMARRWNANAGDTQESDDDLTNPKTSDVFAIDGYRVLVSLATSAAAHYHGDEEQWKNERAHDIGPKYMLGVVVPVIETAFACAIRYQTRPVFDDHVNSKQTGELFYLYTVIKISKWATRGTAPDEEYEGKAELHSDGSEFGGEALHSKFRLILLDILGILHPAELARLRGTNDLPPHIKHNVDKYNGSSVVHRAEPFTSYLSLAVFILSVRADRDERSLLSMLVYHIPCHNTSASVNDATALSSNYADYNLLRRDLFYYAGLSGANRYAAFAEGEYKRPVPNYTLAQYQRQTLVLFSDAEQAQATTVAHYMPLVLRAVKVIDLNYSWKSLIGTTVYDETHEPERRHTPLLVDAKVLIGDYYDPATVRLTTEIAYRTAAADHMIEVWNRLGHDQSNVLYGSGAYSALLSQGQNPDETLTNLTSDLDFSLHYDEPDWTMTAGVEVIRKLEHELPLGMRPYVQLSYIPESSAAEVLVSERRKLTDGAVSAASTQRLYLTDMYRNKVLGNFNRQAQLSSLQYILARYAQCLRGHIVIGYTIKHIDKPTETVVLTEATLRRPQDELREKVLGTARTLPHIDTLLVGCCSLEEIVDAALGWNIKLSKDATTKLHIADSVYDGVNAEAFVAMQRHLVVSGIGPSAKWSTWMEQIDEICRVYGLEKATDVTTVRPWDSSRSIVEQTSGVDKMREWVKNWLQEWNTSNDPEEQTSIITASIEPDAENILYVQLRHETARAECSYLHSAMMREYSESQHDDYMIMTTNLIEGGELPAFKVMTTSSGPSGEFETETRQVFTREDMFGTGIEFASNDRATEFLEKAAQTFKVYDSFTTTIRYARSTSNSIAKEWKGGDISTIEWNRSTGDYAEARKTFVQETFGDNDDTRRFLRPV